VEQGQVRVVERVARRCFIECDACHASPKIRKDEMADGAPIRHGRGADANDLADIAPYLNPQDGRGRLSSAEHGYRFVFPNAPRPFEACPGMTFGFTWFDGLPPEPKSLAESRKLVLEFIDDIVAKYPTTPGKIIVSGFSQGGMVFLIGSGSGIAAPMTFS